MVEVFLHFETELKSRVMETYKEELIALDAFKKLAESDPRYEMRKSRIIQNYNLKMTSLELVKNSLKEGEYLTQSHELVTARQRELDAHALRWLEKNS